MGWCRKAGIAGMLIMIATGHAMAAQPAEDNSPAGLERLQKLAGRGDVAAALRIGVLYDTGDGVPQDSRLASRWYRQAADGGSAIAAFDLATLYDAGRMDERDAAEALRWYRASAARGFGRAAYVAAAMIEAGDGTASDPVEAAHWYRRALTAGVVAARARLVALEAATAPPAAPSQAKAQQAFTAAVEQWRLNGLDSQDPQATASLRTAASSGFPLAEYDLAYSYEHGVGMTRDAALAYAWYGRAAASDGAPGLKAAAAVNRDRLASQVSDADRSTANATVAKPTPGAL